MAWFYFNLMKFRPGPTANPIKYFTYCTQVPQPIFLENLDLSINTGDMPLYLDGPFLNQTKNGQLCQMWHVADRVTTDMS